MDGPHDIDDARATVALVRLVDDLAGLAAPNCERDLVPLVLDARGLAWRCPECGLARL